MISRLWWKAYLFIKGQLSNKGSCLGVCLAPITAASAIRAWVYRWTLAVEDNIISDDILCIYYLSPSEKTNKAAQHGACHGCSDKRARTKGFRRLAAQETIR